jgi:hypothetical protein
MSRNLANGFAWLLLGAALGCNSQVSRSESKVATAQFGLFFGGQVQQRVELPFELDSTRQTQGFHLRFSGPVKHPTLIEWTVDYPTARTGPRGPSNAPRAQRTEHATVSVGADRFEQSLTLRPTDVPGTYNIRVCVDDELVMDRPFLFVTKKSSQDD